MNHILSPNTYILATVSFETHMPWGPLTYTLRFLCSTFCSTTRADMM